MRPNDSDVSYFWSFLSCYSECIKLISSLRYQVFCVFFYSEKTDMWDFFLHLREFVLGDFVRIPPAALPFFGDLSLLETLINKRTCMTLQNKLS